jgi:cation diffusion facilitator CzcD-associated flavoprotein CzcO
VLHVVEEGIDVMAASRPIDMAETRTHADEFDVGQLFEHERERFTFVSRHTRRQRQCDLHSPILPDVQLARTRHSRLGLTPIRMGLCLYGTSMTTREIDPDALQSKYRAERDKRLRSDGSEQYVEPVGQFSHYLDDPYVEATPREPLFDEVTVAFIGGGFAGLVTGARLKQAGIDDVRIIEKGGDFGGTWYWNRYPGAQCDTAAFVYLPLLEETGHMPTEKYTHAPEILDHCRRIANHFDLYDNACLSTEVTGLDWDDEAERWIIRTNRGDEMRAKFVAMGTGPLHRPKLPGIPGIETYQGHSFHTSRWDYEYTGGNPADASLDQLADKRVGVIGTGATAVQCVPHLARACGELFVFQRTPSSIDVRNNHDIDVEWFKTLEPGWQAEWLMNFTTLQTGGFTDEDLVMDGWTDISKRIRDKVLSSGGDFTRESFIKAYEDSDDEKMTEIRDRVDALVTDHETAEALKPWYRQLCKRPCFHDEYLDSYNEPGTHLIDTDGKGVERIDESGVWANGEHYELDCLIYASGFEVGTEYARRAGFDAVGRGGEKLSQHWADGMQSLHGIHVHGFPNMFIVGHTQGANLISNIPHNLTEAGQTIAMIIDHALDVGAAEVEATEAAEQAWVERLEGGAVARMTSSPDCTPGYYNNEGQSTGRRGTLNSMGYPEGPVAYFQFIDSWRSDGEFEGLEFR